FAGWGHLGLIPLGLILWSLGARIAGPIALAGPLETLNVLGRGLSEGWLASHLALTLRAALAGFLLAVAAGLWLGFLVGMRRFWTHVLEPLAFSVYALPKVTLFPIFLFLFGLDVESKVAFGMFHG